MRSRAGLAWRIRGLAGAGAIALIGGLISCGVGSTDGAGPPGAVKPAPPPSTLERGVP